MECLAQHLFMSLDDDPKKVEIYLVRTKK